jgi:predicted nucleic acid-binding protein
VRAVHAGGALLDCDGADYARLSSHLSALPFAASGPRTLRLALESQARLAQTPEISHRVKPIDLLVAVIADEHDVGVLYYDHDYDVIAKRSGLRLNSVWVADRGSAA